MSTLVEVFHNLIDPQWIMQHGGLYIVLFIVFAETGLFVGFFLPGDSLLFITGMIIGNTAMPAHTPAFNVVYWIVQLSAAGIAGNYVGYWFGRSGPALLTKDGRLLKKQHLDRATEFYVKNGGKAIVLARFLPVIRTFAPIIAGMVRMNLRIFSIYNVLGSFLWVGSIVAAGFLLGENTWVKENVEKIILAIVAVTTLPVALKMIRANKAADAAKQQATKL